MHELDDIRVYDPKQEHGVSLSQFRSAYQAVYPINPILANLMIEGMNRRLSDSNVGTENTYETLGMKLWVSPNRGYFQRYPNVVAIVFMDGRYNREFTCDDYPTSQLSELAEEADSIPLVIRRPKANMAVHEHFIDQLRELFLKR